MQSGKRLNQIQLKSRLGSNGSGHMISAAKWHVVAGILLIFSKNMSASRSTDSLLLS